MSNYKLCIYRFYYLGTDIGIWVPGLVTDIVEPISPFIIGHIGFGYICFIAIKRPIGTGSGDRYSYTDISFIIGYIFKVLFMLTSLTSDMCSFFAL
jgi:hypothetical protein